MAGDEQGPGDYYALVDAARKEAERAQTVPITHAVLAPGWQVSLVKIQGYPEMLCFTLLLPQMGAVNCIFSPEMFERISAAMQQKLRDISNQTVQ
jgi:hypothetical protein